MGYNSNQNYVCKLNKAIYGLKQAPHVWFDRLKNTLSKLWFKTTKSDTSLFTKVNNNSIIYLLIYVDDRIITSSNSKDLDKITQYLDQLCSINDLGEIN